MKKIVIFASGSGTNAQNIVLHFNNSSKLNQFHIFSNNANAKVLEKARNLSVPTKIFSKEELNSDVLLKNLIEIEPDLIILAGFLLKFPSNCIAAFPNKIINIHPSLLPKFGGKGMYGVKVQEAVMAAKEEFAGCTVHFVSDDIDAGEIIIQKAIRIDYTETPWQLGGRIFTEENKLLVEAIRLLLRP
ncbi:MAG: phosphoribosylglycinamide formyltransferase [Cytophagia bacterium]|nr:phosphoribosylglycinamide formyltransferase [Cytophagia bacterium]